MTRRAPLPAAERRCLVGVAVLSAAQIALELLFVKLSGYEFGTVSLAVLGLSLLGVALASPLTRWLGGGEVAAVRALSLLAVTVALAGVWLFSLAHRLTAEPAMLFRLVITCVACLVVLALSSVPIYTTLRAEPGRVPARYAATLAGGALGAPLALLALSHLGDAPAYASMLLVVSLANAILMPAGRKRLVATALAIVLAGGAGLVLPRIDRAVHPNSIAVVSHAFSRLDVEQAANGGLRFRTAGINAGTSTIPGPVRRMVDSHLERISMMPYRLHPASVLVIGSGSGRDVTEALRHGAERVTAVEINGSIPALMGRMQRRIDDPYQDPSVRLIVDEGRETAARLAANGDRFDLAYVPIASLFGSAGQALTQTYLMTREAISAYAALLTPRGSIAFYIPVEWQDRVLLALVTALGDAGTQEPLDHVFGVRATEKQSDAVIAQGIVLLARPSVPFDAGEISALLGGDAWTPLSLPGDLERANSTSPLSDDSPFFCNDVWTPGFQRSLTGGSVRFTHHVFEATLVLFLVAATFLVFRRQQRRLMRGHELAAFALMGVGFSAYQTGAIQRLGFLVGHPALAVALVLPCTLAGSALGAVWSGRIAAARYVRIRVVSTLGLVLLLVALAGLPPHWLIRPGWPHGVRLLLTAFAAGVPFVPMASFFPIAFARAERRDPVDASDAWLMNGVAAVLGSVVSVYVSMMMGFAVVIIGAALAYAFLALWDIGARAGAADRRVLAAPFGLALLLLVVAVGLESRAHVLKDQASAARGHVVDRAGRGALSTLPQEIPPSPASSP